MKQKSEFLETTCFRLHLSKCRNLLVLNFELKKGAQENNYDHEPGTTANRRLY